MKYPMCVPVLAGISGISGVSGAAVRVALGREARKPVTRASSMVSSGNFRPLMSEKACAKVVKRWMMSSDSWSMVFSV
jgi:hypothetical protein